MSNMRFERKGAAILDKKPGDECGICSMGIGTAPPTKVFYYYEDNNMNPKLPEDIIRKQIVQECPKCGCGFTSWKEYKLTFAGQGA